MIYIVGAGLGNVNTLTLKAIDVIKNADVVLSSPRISKEISELNFNIRILPLTDMVAFINNINDKTQNIAVIATGDVCFHSIALTLKKQLNENIDIKFINGISSLQYLCSKLLISYSDIKLLSLHGTNKFLVPYVCYNEKVFCLTGGENSVDKIIDTLISHNLLDVEVTVGERLSYDDEKITTKKAKDLIGMKFDKLAVMLIHNSNYVKTHMHIGDDEFIRGKAPMTKCAIRDLSVSTLGISPTDIVYDIGAGTGSVTVCLARKATESIVYAIEKKDDAYSLIKENIEKFGAYNIIPISGLAPLENDKLLPPDKVFIGGSSGNLYEILQWVLNKNKFATIVITALTLETLLKAIESFKKLNMKYEISCINASISQKLGRYNMMKAENPIFIIKGVLDCGN